MKPYIKLITATLLLIPIFTGLAEGKKDLPNIILIMVDDMGFSDLGYHGGEIQTPNLDLLAQNGVKYSNFYNSGKIGISSKVAVINLMYGFIIYLFLPPLI